MTIWYRIKDYNRKKVTEMTSNRSFFRVQRHICLSCSQQLLEMVVVGIQEVIVSYHQGWQYDMQDYDFVNNAILF